MAYGDNELRYAQPIAEGLVQNIDFRKWFLSKTRFAPHAEVARLLDSEQKARRSPGAATWWRSYWTGNSYPFKGECGERETDLLAVFDVSGKFRFAIHVEVKAPKDIFGIEQAKDYAIRSKCWAGAGRNPKTVLPHDEGICVLCCDRAFSEKHPMELSFFDSVITFDEIGSFISPFPLP